MMSGYYVPYAEIKHGRKYDPTQNLKIFRYFAQNANTNGS